MMTAHHDNRPCTEFFIRLILGLLLLLMAAVSAGAAETSKHQKFDHTRTGFPLTGAHVQARCESCHVQGVFKATPKQCASCHSQGSKTASTSKPANHIPTTAACESCHRATSWTPANFSHAGVAPGRCAK